MIQSLSAAFELATDHSNTSDDQCRFLFAFAVARMAVVQGRDVEAQWLRMNAQRDVSPAALAGFIEGLASTRCPVQWGGAR